MRRRNLLGLGALGIFPLSPIMASTVDRWDDGVDVLIAGAGAAGLSAAVTAAEQGASVLIAEKMPMIGGDTLISGGKYNAVDPKRQKPQGIEDSVEYFTEQILASGAGRNSRKIAETLARESTVTLEWLEELGLQFMPTVSEVFGSGFPRSHTPVLPRGTGYIRVLSEAALRQKVRILTNSPVLSFITDSTGRAVGAKIQTKQSVVNVEARMGVVVASGGFGASQHMREVYTPEVAELPFDSHPGATGELLIAAERVGAKLVNMEFAECVPGAAAEFSYQIRLDYVPSRVIIINSKGQRFVDETAGRRAIAEAVLKEMKEGPCFSIASDETLSQFDHITQKNIYRGLFAGQAWKAMTAKDLGEKLGISGRVLAEEIHRAADERGLSKPPYWATRLFLRVHHTLGGVDIDCNARVLGIDGEPIPGLYAAGAVTGSVHGAERMGGNGLPSACAFGRIAGANVTKL